MEFLKNGHGKSRNFIAGYLWEPCIIIIITITLTLTVSLSDGGGSWMVQNESELFGIQSVNSQAIFMKLCKP